MNKLLLFGDKPSNKSAVAMLEAIKDKEFYLSIGIPQVDLDGVVLKKEEVDEQDNR